MAGKFPFIFAAKSPLYNLNFPKTPITVTLSLVHNTNIFFHFLGGLGCIKLFLALVYPAGWVFILHEIEKKGGIKFFLMLTFGI